MLFIIITTITIIFDIIFIIITFSLVVISRIVFFQLGHFSPSAVCAQVLRFRASSSPLRISISYFIIGNFMPLLLGINVNFTPYA